MKKLCLALALILMLTACSNTGGTANSLPPQESAVGSGGASYSEASQKLISRREAVLKMLEEIPRPAFAHRKSVA